MRGAESDDFACLLPALLAGVPEPFHVAVGTSWVGNAAQASHRSTQWDVTVSPIDGVPLPSKWKPCERVGLRTQRRYSRQLRHRISLLTSLRVA